MNIYRYTNIMAPQLEVFWMRKNEDGGKFRVWDVNKNVTSQPRGYDRRMPVHSTSSMYFKSSKFGGVSKSALLDNDRRPLKYKLSNRSFLTFAKRIKNVIVSYISTLCHMHYY
jgi:hypothetical protein